MKKIVGSSIMIICILWGCQKELHFPSSPQMQPVAEKLVQAIVVADTILNDYDSIVFRYYTDRIQEVHYGLRGDSTTRTYHYDAYNRLSEIEDTRALYYTNADVARNIRFQYNGKGQIVQTSTDFRTVSNIIAHFNYSQQGDDQFIVIYDTSYRGPGYDLDWANRIIYDVVSKGNYIKYDSCIYMNYQSGGMTTRVNSYVYDAGMNPSSFDKFTYSRTELLEWGTTTVTRDKSAPAYEALRKKLYGNLANWYESASVSQDDNYRPFLIPGGISKKIEYAGFSNNGGAAPQPISQIFDYKNLFDSDLLLRSDRTASTSGRGTIYSQKQIRYYYW